MGGGLRRSASSQSPPEINAGPLRAAHPQPPPGLPWAFWSVVVCLVVAMPEAVAIRIARMVIHGRMTEFVMAVRVRRKSVMHIFKAGVHAVVVTLLPGFVELVVILILHSGRSSRRRLCMSNAVAEGSQSEWKGKSCHNRNTLCLHSVNSLRALRRAGAHSGWSARAAKALHRIAMISQPRHRPVGARE